MNKFTNTVLSLFLTHIILTQLASANLEEAEDVSPKKVSIIPLVGMIDGGIHSSLKRRVELAKENGSNLIIFEIDTYGGQLEAAFEISEYISNIANTKTIAFIPTKAISA